MMQGFDPKFADFPDYIIAITKEIWEDRCIATLHDYYAPDIVVRAPGSIVQGNANVIGATMATLAEFPDRTLLGEDVIWSGSPEVGMLSSHRILSTATHTADGVYGKASGTKLAYRIMADCHAKDNRIDDEWIIRDQGAIVRQMGMNPRDYAQALIEKEGGPQACVKPFTPQHDISGPYKGRGNDHAIGQRYADILGSIMDADMAMIPRAYDRAVQTELPGGVTGHGIAPIDTFWMSLRAAFPTAQFDIHHIIGRDDPSMPPRAAIRWSLHGEHSGWGAFGKPTGAEVHVMGISHAEFGSFGAAPLTIRREYTLYDETAIWKQILLFQGGV